MRKKYRDPICFLPWIEGGWAEGTVLIIKMANGKEESFCFVIDPTECPDPFSCTVIKEIPLAVCVPYPFN